MSNEEASAVLLRQNESLNRPVTRFEDSKIVGVRAEMLARGHPPLVQLTEDMRRNDMYDVKLIAQEEYRRGLIPFVLKRSSSDGKVTASLAIWRE